MFEEQAEQINLRRRREEIAGELETLHIDMEKVQEQTIENKERKLKIAEKIEATTTDFQEEAAHIKAELDRVQKKLKEEHQRKEIAEDQALFLLDDRGSYGSAKKYYPSISEYLGLAK